MSWRVTLVATAAIGLAAVGPVDGYLKLAVSNGVQNLPARGSRVPIRYFVTDQSIANVTSSELAGAVGRAAATWQAVATSSVAFEFVGFTAAPPNAEDGVSAIGFLNRPDMERTLAATQFMVDEITGTIVEADIFFNSSIPWSVAPAGESGRFDLETIALHEMGHMLGLGHSALGETELRASGGRRVIAAGAVMFPIASAAGSVDLRVLQPDDEAGAGDLYPDATFTSRLGSVSGLITKGAQGVEGAHVVAFHLQTGALIGNFTLDGSGRYAIAGLEPGPYVLRVEPLDDASVESFFSSADDVDLDFRVAYADRLAIVPRGGGAAAFDIRVIPK